MVGDTVGDHSTGPNAAADGAAAVVARLGIPHELAAPLGQRTWFGVGGWAEVLALPQSIEQAQAVAAVCHQQGLPLRVLGKGANLLVRDGEVAGVVMALEGPFFQQVRYSDGSLLGESTSDEASAGSDRAADPARPVTIHARGGVDLFKLVRQTARQGLSGLEHVAGIPASVGGAVRMNAGGAFGEIGDCVQSVTVLRPDGSIETLARGQITFGYRHTDITAPVILEVAFSLNRADPASTTARMKEIFGYKKTSQPMAAQSAGCAFKNPKDQTDKGAGQLIDEAGLKGHAKGGARVSQTHGNFIVLDRDSARADDVVRLIEHIEQTVRECHGITLEREVVVWP